MFQLEKILVPVDFSASGLIAANHVAALARHFHSEVTLLHVNDFSVLHPLHGPLGFGITSEEAERAEHLSTRQQQLDVFGVAELSGVCVKRLLRCGDPAKLIVECAHEDKSKLIFMPTHGHGSFRRYLLGSVTAKVLHDAESPVWTSTHLAEPLRFDPTEVRHVMCAVDFGPQSSKVLCWAASFASEFGAKLTAVHAVLQTPPTLPDRYTFFWHDQAHLGAGERLRGLVFDSRVQADALVVSNGDIPRALSVAAKEKRAELLVIGRSSAGDLAKRLGTHAYYIICNAPCPVVSI
jgi:nucleotide-binding universal stress UspA family protein